MSVSTCVSCSVFNGATCCNAVIDGLAEALLNTGAAVILDDEAKTTSLLCLLTILS